MRTEKDLKTTDQILEKSLQFAKELEKIILTESDPYIVHTTLLNYVVFNCFANVIDGVDVRTLLHKEVDNSCDSYTQMKEKVPTIQ